MIRALSLLSGGLDSMLAVKILQEQGIEVIGITYTTPFFGSSKAEEAAKQLGIDLKIIDLTEAHLDVVKLPKHGYGRFVNPCIDCHALMIRKAGDLLEELSAHFISTGEVLGQRPKSQNYRALRLVEEESGYPGLVVRPLSGKLLPPTIPEKEGWIDREKLLDISGRSRKRQMALAEYYGIKEYPSPAGGCLLTEQVFAIRLKDVMNTQENWGVNEVELLKVGRHLRLSPKTKLIVGRNQEENKRLEMLAKPEDLLIRAAAFKGPTAILRGPAEEREDFIKQAAAITARYGKGKEEEELEMKYYHPSGPVQKIIVKPARDEEIKPLLIN
ncbi:MAG TPA: tRNA 4-thiouridine(8) synthase ThiI [Clostridia bacterium]|nr:tRNA 4-thiouridine(8) synthase ThiI [Clostridia bacterium]